MQNDLISRSALRDDFIKNCHMECYVCPDYDQEEGECNLVRCAPTVDAVPFDTVAHMCKCSHLACVDPDLQIYGYVCGHTIPKGQSWGVCSFETCPLVKEGTK